MEKLLKLLISTFMRRKRINVHKLINNTSLIIIIILSSCLRCGRRYHHDHIVLSQDPF